VSARSFISRWRVRLGYPVAIVVLALARPTPRSIVAGGLVGAIGLVVRGLAAGHLHKQTVLTMTGPYAYTRNPLYLGSAILTLGAAVATWSWIAACILLVYFGAFYSIVMRSEEQELRMQHGEAFDAYARAVPLFLPRFTAAKLAPSAGGSFSWKRYVKNREYRAAIGFLLLLALLLLIWRLRMP
jgi:protein-S-isoprenylcysteine O-methyltransferase Ste14